MKGGEKSPTTSGSRALEPRKAALISRGLAEIEAGISVVQPKEIRVGNVDSLSLLRQIGEGAILQSAVSPDGSLTAIWTVKGVFIHRNPSGERRGYLPLGEQVTTLTISPDKRLVAIGTNGGNVTLWRYLEGEKTRELAHGYSSVAVVRFTPDNRSVVVAAEKRGGLYGMTSSHSIYLCDIETASSVLVGNCDERPYDLRLSPDGKYMIERPGGFPDCCKLWDLRSKRLVRSTTEHGFDEMPVISSDSRYLGTRGTPVGKVSRIETGEVVERWSLVDDVDVPDWILDEYERESHDDRIISVLEQYTPALHCLEFAPANKLVAAGGKDNKVRIWDVKTGLQHKVLVLDRRERFGSGIPQAVRSLSFSPHSEMLAVGREHGEVPVLEADTGTVARELEGHPEGSYSPVPDRMSVAFSPDGMALATAGGDGKLRVWEFQTWKLRWERQFPAKVRILDIRFSPTGRLIAVAMEGALEQILSAVDGTTIHSLQIPESETRPGGRFASPGAVNRYYHSNSIAFTPDEALVASDGSLGPSVYELKSRIRSTISVPKYDPLDPVGSLKLLSLGVASPDDGRSVLSKDGSLCFVGRHGSILVIDIAKREVIDVLEGHVGRVSCLALSPDGTILASGGDDGIIHLWGVSSPSSVSS